MGLRQSVEGRGVQLGWQQRKEGRGLGLPAPLAPQQQPGCLHNGLRTAFQHHHHQLVVLLLLLPSVLVLLLLLLPPLVLLVLLLPLRLLLRRRMWVLLLPLSLLVLVLAGGLWWRFEEVAGGLWLAAQPDAVRLGGGAADPPRCSASCRTPAQRAPALAHRVEPPLVFWP